MVTSTAWMIMCGMGSANEISWTTNHLSTLQPVTNEQSSSREKGAGAERIDWRLEGAEGGQLSVIWACEAWGTPVHLLHRAGRPF